MGPDKYQQTIQTAIEQGMTTIEVGPNEQAAEQALATAYTTSIQNNPSLANVPVTFLLRIGYRTIGGETATNTKKDPTSIMDEINPTNSKEKVTDRPHVPVLLPHDVQVDGDSNNDNDSTDTLLDETEPSSPKVLHNIGSEWITTALETSPLVKLAQSHPNVHIVALLHNPEVQAMLLSSSRQERIQQRLADAFMALETMVRDKNHVVDGYGVVSNGMSLPTDHPLHLAHTTVIAAAMQAKEQLSLSPTESLALQVVEFPANLLETKGFDVAHKLKDFVKEKTTTDPTLSQLQVYTLRPLTCYPDLGTGSGHPFILADYLLPATMEKKLQWSHTIDIDTPPDVYTIALRTAMSHFDAEILLEKKSRGEELSPEERETLDGCKLMQSLLHDVDAGLEKVRSFQAHEDELYNKIIPLIHDTFESYDEETANVLQSFFGAYTLAVRHAIARNTRKLLVQGETGSNIPKYDIPEDERLQEFALRYVFETGGDSIDKVIVGCAKAEHVLDTVEIVNRYFDDTKEGEA